MAASVRDQLLAQNPNLTDAQLTAAIKARLYGGVAPVRATDGNYYNSIAQQLQNPEDYEAWRWADAKSDFYNNNNQPFAAQWGASNTSGKGAIPAPTGNQNTVPSASAASPNTVPSNPFSGVVSGPGQPNQVSSNTVTSSPAGLRQADWSAAQNLWNNNAASYRNRQIANLLRKR